MLSRLTRSSGTRYLVAGLGCALVNNALLIGSDYAGFHYAVGIGLSIVVVLPLSYLLHARWTFVKPAAWANFTRYLAGSMSSIVVASLTVWFFRGALSLPMLAVAPLATVAMTAYNYLMARWAVTYRPPCPNSVTI